MNKEFCIIFGTRPEYLKIKPLITQFKLQNIYKYKVIYVMQHENINEDIEKGNTDR